jgi:chemotaxis protein CheD
MRRLGSHPSALPLSAESASPFAHIRRRHDARFNAVVATLQPGDYYVAAPGELIATVLGSCVSACIRDRQLRIGGMNHFMLPEGRAEGGSVWSEAANFATRYGNVAMERLINEILKLGAKREDLEIKLVGGGRVLEAMIDVGARNIAFVRQYVLTEAFCVVGEDLGDVYARKVLYDPASGDARVKRLNRAADAVVVAETRYQQDIDCAPQFGEIELF